MPFNYKPLWKLLIDKEMNKKEFMKEVDISKSTIDKMSRSENISLSILDKICTYFNCDVEEVIQHYSEGDK